MSLQILVSTMNQKDFHLLERMKIQSDAIIINQCDDEGIFNLDKDGFKIKWINSKNRGLSRSRNMAIDNADRTICVLADDDLEYVPNYRDIILQHFKLYPDADVIAFQVEGIEAKFKDYYPKPRKINYLTSMKISSVEIAFRLDKVKAANIRFNELFGAGAKYCMGEENIFLIECLKKGLNVHYVPKKIAYLHIGESSWFKGFNDNYFINRGAIFAAMSKRFSVPLIVQFAIRKHKLFKDEMTRIQAIKLMLEGKRRLLEHDMNA
jgi:glycosyltransferase involved in cell wall biosynthesis